MASNQASNGSPDPFSPGMCADTEQQRKTCERAEPDAQLYRVPSGGPEDAEGVVFVVAVVAVAFREDTALFLSVCEVFVAIWVAN